MEEVRRLAFFVMEERLEGEGEVCLAVIVVGLVGLAFDQFMGILTEQHEMLVLVDRS